MSVDFNRAIYENIGVEPDFRQIDGPSRGSRQRPTLPNVKSEMQGKQEGKEDIDHVQVLEYSAVLLRSVLI